MWLYTAKLRRVQRMPCSCWAADSQRSEGLGSNGFLDLTTGPMQLF